MDELTVVLGTCSYKNKKDKKIRIIILFLPYISSHKMQTLATSEWLDFDRKFITAGWRGNIFRFKNFCKKEAISSIYISNIQREILILTKIQSLAVKSIPLIYASGQDWFVSDWIEGMHFDDAWEDSRFLKSLLWLQLLKIAYDLDLYQIEHGELHRPMSNVLVDDNGKVWLIDFDQGSFHNTKNKNLRHLAQWIQSLGLIPIEEMRRVGGMERGVIYLHLQEIIKKI
jgi:putative serine/threonine protein kinase